MEIVRPVRSIALHGSSGTNHTVPWRKWISWTHVNINVASSKYGKSIVGIKPTQHFLTYRMLILYWHNCVFIMKRPLPTSEQKTIYRSTLPTYAIGHHLMWQLRCKIKWLSLCESPVYIDSSLFSDFMSSWYNNAARQLSALSRLSKSPDLNGRKLIFKCFVSNNLTYCPIIWYKQNNRKIYLKRIKECALWLL